MALQSLWRSAARGTLARDRLGSPARLLVESSGTLPADAASELNVAWHDRHTLRVKRAAIGVLKQPDEISFTCFLQSEHGRRLEPQVRLANVLRDLANEPLEGQLSNQQARRLLVAANFAKSNGAGLVPARQYFAGSVGLAARCDRLVPRGLGRTAVGQLHATYLCGLLTAPDGDAFFAAFVESCLRGAFPPVDLRAVCFVRAIFTEMWV